MDEPANYGSIPLSPETVAARRDRRERRMAMTAEDHAAEIRKAREQQRIEYAREMWRDFTAWWRR